MLANLFLLVVTASGNPADVREQARQAWLTRALSVERAVTVLAAQDAWLSVEKTPESHLAVSRAAYWLGLLRQDVDPEDATLIPLFERGLEHARRAEALQPKLAEAYYWHILNKVSVGQRRGIAASIWMYPELMSLARTLDGLEPGAVWGGTSRIRGAIITRAPIYLLRLKGSSLDEGERHFQESIKAAPSFVANRVWLAELKLRMGQREAAIRLLVDAIAQPPLDGDPEAECWNVYERARAARMLEAVR